jgi:hypothetical protein
MEAREAVKQETKKEFAPIQLMTDLTKPIQLNMFDSAPSMIMKEDIVEVFN